MKKIFKFTEKSVNILQRKVIEEFENIKYRYTVKNEAPFNPEKDGLKLVKGDYPIPDKFELFNDTDGKKDFENSRLIYEAFSMLSPSEADDQRLWVYLTHVDFHNYTRNRWTTKRTNAAVILDRFFYVGTGRGTRTKNSISRLWWTAHLTVRKNETDEDRKWELTKAIFSSQDLQVSLLERAMGSYENVRTAFLEFYISNKKNISGKYVQWLARDLNNAGGIYLLPFLSKEEIKKRLEKLLSSY